MKSVAILQSNYIPWKGYFDLINSVDEFVIYDDMQYTRRDWRNRNKIKMSDGLRWLSIPVDVKGKYFQKINETQVSDLSWSLDHWKTISQVYSKARYFKEYNNIFEEFYSKNQEKNLSLINFRLMELVNSILGIKTRITWSSDYELLVGQTERLLGICQQAGADIYLSGPAAKDYFDESLAEKMGIKVEWMDYSGYPEYQQLYSPFEHGVSILDLIFNEGPNATKFMKSFQS
jgi:hypothetical protein